jgi:hypothetical protein
MAGLIGFAALSAACNALFGLEEREPFPPDAGIGAGGAGGAGGSTSTSGSGTAGNCPGTMVACDGVCVDPATDPAHCGGCGKACNVAGGEVCSDHCTSREWALWSVSELPSYTAGVDTVLDNVTKLTWQRFVPPESYTREDAKAYCAALILEGTGWRLPTRIEIQSIVDYSKPQPGPLIDTVVFPNAPNDDFWCSSGLSLIFGWVMKNDGRTVSGDAMDLFRVRCVR